MNINITITAGVSGQDAAVSCVLFLAPGDYDERIGWAILSAECRQRESHYRYRMIEPCADVFFPLLWRRQWLP